MYTVHAMLNTLHFSIHILKNITLISLNNESVFKLMINNLENLSFR